MKSINPLAVLSVFLIKEIWQKRIGLKYKKKHNILCRFYPDCSNYAVLALEEYGFVKGWQLAFNRVKSCNDNNTESCINYP